MGNQKSGSGYFSAELMPVVLKFATAKLKCRVDDMLSFGTLSSVLGASIKAMLGCPGFGQMKACRLHDILIARWQTLGQPA
jgi:DNA repair protein RadC